MSISKNTIKNMFRQIELWPDWRNGRVWRVPIFPEIYHVAALADQPASPEDIPVVEFYAEPAIKHPEETKVWLFHGRHGEQKVLCHVMDRK